LIEEVFGGEIDGLGGEVPDDVGPVAPPQGQSAFLADAPGEAVGDASVWSFHEFGIVLLSLQ